MQSQNNPFYEALRRRFDEFLYSKGRFLKTQDHFFIKMLRKWCWIFSILLDVLLLETTDGEFTTIYTDLLVRRSYAVGGSSLR